MRLDRASATTNGVGVIFAAMFDRCRRERIQNAWAINDWSRYNKNPSPWESLNEAEAPNRVTRN